ncbi:MAG: MarR family transcriptional regulator [Rhizomicrobium sp.]
MRRLSERIDGDAKRAYAAYGVVFEQRWFGVLNQLVRNGPMTVGEIAATLRITHASVSQSRQSLVQAGYVAVAADPDDGRKRQLTLTQAGRDIAAHLSPLWKAFDAAARELNAEAQHADIALDRLEAALERRSLQDRIAQHLESRPARKPPRQ